MFHPGKPVLTQILNREQQPEKFEDKEKFERYWSHTSPNDKKQNFFLNPSVILVKLPEELKNEPYTVIDNKYRPEIIHAKKSSFKFKIIPINKDYSKVFARIGLSTDSRNSTGIPENYTPEKLVSDISVVDVYENYGLNITYSYLHYIYYDNVISLKHPEYLLLYLEVSLLLLGNDYRTRGTVKDIGTQILYLSSILLSNFLLIDSNKIKLQMPLTIISQVIPPEIIAKITGSRRITKVISNIVEYNKCIDDPMTSAELNIIRTNKNYPTIHINNKYCCEYVPLNDPKIVKLSSNTVHFSYSLKVLNNCGPFNLTITDADIEIYEYQESQIEQYSLSIYRKAYVKRGCKLSSIKAAILLILDKISKMTVTINNIGIVCGWIVQLSVDTGIVEEKELKDHTALEKTLHFLANSAKKLVQDDSL
jgi:hypothetical protein